MRFMTMVLISIALSLSVSAASAAESVSSGEASKVGGAQSQFKKSAVTGLKLLKSCYFYKECANKCAECVDDTCYCSSCCVAIEKK
jgi:hypothetical protein